MVIVTQIQIKNKMISLRLDKVIVTILKIKKHAISFLKSHAFYNHLVS